MSLKPSINPSEQAQRLIDHARKISQELYTFSVELSEQNREKAQQKINYGKQVLNSLEQLPGKYLNLPDAGADFLNIVYVNYISVKPFLENALIDLQKRIDEKQFFVIPEVENDKENQVKTKKNEILEPDWKGPSDLGNNDYSSLLKNLINAAERELQNDNDEEESEEESEAESDEEEEEGDEGDQEPTETAQNNINSEGENSEVKKVDDVLEEAVDNENGEK